MTIKPRYISVKCCSQVVGGGWGREWWKAESGKPGRGIDHENQKQ
jgi:hypothetical protein